MVNLVGAFALGLSDEILGVVHDETGQHVSASAALTTLLANPGVTVDDLSGSLGISGSGTVRLVDRLEAASLIERHRSQGDGRAVELLLTEVGRRLAQRVLAERRAVIKRALNALSDDEQAALERSVEKMLAALTPDRARADFICRLCDYECCPQDSCPVEQAVQ